MTYRWKKQQVAAARPWIANTIIRSMAHDDATQPHATDWRWQSVAPPRFVHFFRPRRRDESRAALPSLVCAGLLMAACLIVLWPRGSDAQMHFQKKALESTADSSSVKPPVD